MPRAFASSDGAAAAAGFGPPWLAMLGVAVVSVWVITLAVLLCGDGAEETPAERERRRARARRGAMGATIAASTASSATAASTCAPACC